MPYLSPISLTLDERIRLIARARSSGLPVESDQAEQAQKHLGRWRAQAPFAGETDEWAQRLAADAWSEADVTLALGLSRDRLAQLLTETHGERPQSERPARVDVHSRAPKDGVAAILDRLPPMVRVAIPLIRDEVAQFVLELERIVETAGREAVSSEAMRMSAADSLAQVLLALVPRTFLLELNVARLRGELDGSTSEDRFTSFCSVLDRPDAAAAFFEEYGVLARRLRESVEFWRTNFLEIVARLCADRTLVGTLVPGPQPLGPLTTVQIGAGDTHNRGRAVAILEFSAGQRVVYKPRSLALDARFGEFLGWLNAHCDIPLLTPLDVLDRGEYGWARFVAQRPCESRAELAQFYERQGAVLALLYALEAADFHQENLIASGAHPILIDVEALFHARPSRNAGAFVATRNPTEETVLRIGMLPQRSFARAADGTDGVDISGIGGQSGQLTPQPVLQVEGRGTDEMRVVRKRVEMGAVQNRPTIGGAQAQPHEFAEQLERGFVSMYRELVRVREVLCAPGGPLDAFSSAPTRCILRPTFAYARLLTESTHPDFMRDGIGREALYDRLWAPGVNWHAGHAIVVRAERADLMRGDIPAFFSRAGSTDLWTSSGERHANFFGESGLDAARDRLARMDEVDLARQRWIVRTSIRTLMTAGGSADRSAGQAHSTRWSTPVGTTPASQVPEQRDSHRDAIEIVRGIASRLVSLCFEPHGRPTWFGVTLIGETQWTVRPLAGDLYAGTSGIALFLAYAGSLLNEPSFTDAARRSIESLISLIDPGENHERIPRDQGSLGSGLFSGWAGILYVQAHLGTLWQDDALLQSAERLAALYGTPHGDEQHLDVIGGSAGEIIGLCSLYAVRPSLALRAQIAAHADHLVRRAVRWGDAGIGWPTTVKAKRPLLGISHGASGIAVALTWASVVCSRVDYREAAERALRYESDSFDPAVGNWPDLRLSPDADPDDASDTYMTAWCHGAPGIGLARLAIARLDPSLEIARDVDRALAAATLPTFEGNHSLCHGSLGNLDLLVSAAQDDRWRQVAPHSLRIGNGILQSLRAQGSLCGVPAGIEQPGFMTGIAGIGYGVLRIVFPDRVPSVLRLDPPKAGS